MRGRARRDQPARAGAAPSVRDALLLGLVQGPSELLPISSSAHIALLGGALRARAERGDAQRQRPVRAEQAELRDALEVALHAGTAVALLIVGRGELRATARELSAARVLTGVWALVPPALAGYLLERAPARRPSSSGAIAAGLALGGAALALADRREQSRDLAQAGPRDGLALGAAQALALLPGVSRNGATLTAARALGFTRGAAQALSWRAGLPVMVGAAALKTRRLGTQRGLPAGGGRVLAAGAGAALLSTLAGAPLIAPARRGRALAPFALYRLGLSLVAVCGSRAGVLGSGAGDRLRSAHNRSR